MSYTYREPVKVIADCLAQQLVPVLAPKPVTVSLAYQKINIPQTGLWVALSILSSEIVPSDDADPSVPALNEVQTAVVHDFIQIDMMSFDDSARQMRAVAAMALLSLNSEALQEQYQIRIARKPGPFKDTSALEPTQYLQRYTTTIQTDSIQTYTLPAGYYNQFPNPQEVTQS